jgi:hypothetical protein
MKNKYILFLACLFILGCKSKQTIFEKGQTYENFRGFEPIDPTEYDEEISIVSNQSILSKKMKLLSPDEIFSFLNNETVLVSIGKVNNEGGISYLPVTISAKNSIYKVTMDYMKFATLGQKNDEGDFIGYKRIGVGLRLISEITTFEAGINIGDLSSIGAAAKANKLNGTLMIEVIGIKSKDVTTILPLPSEINQSTIQNAMQALATIKSKIYDLETKLYPQVMAVKVVKSESIKSIINPEFNIRNEDRYKSKSNNDKKVEDKIQLQFNNNSIGSTNKFDIAKRFEAEGFEFLFQKNVVKAIEKFNESEKAFPTFHSVSEISELLTIEKHNLLNKESRKWKEIYLEIYNNYNWKLSSDIINELEKLSK